MAFSNAGTLSSMVLHNRDTVRYANSGRSGSHASTQNARYNVRMATNGRRGVKTPIIITGDLALLTKEEQAEFIDSPADAMGEIETELGYND